MPDGPAVARAGADPGAGLAAGLPPPRSPLVGRAAEVGRLAGLLDTAAGGQPVVVLVSGDAGVGKTRLVTELAAMAGQRGFTVLTGHCAELGESVPYLAMADALRTATAGPGAGPGLRDAVAARPVLSRLLPDRQASGPDSAGLPGLAQQQLFGAVVGMLSELAAAAPVLLVLEDLHWADRSTRDLVTFLSRVLHRERVCLAVTYRTDDLHRRHPLRPVLAELQRLPGVTAIDLAPLTADAMAEHLTTLSGGVAPAAVLNQVIGRAEGNAYYAEELLAAASGPGSPAGPDGRPELRADVAGTGLAGVWLPGVGAGGGPAAGPAGAGGLPVSLSDLLLARLERLTPAAQRVLRVAAVAGRKLDDELVMQGSGLAAAEYEEAVREAVAARLLVPDSSRGLAFRHALLREAVYADLLPGERTRLHGLLAELLSGEDRLACADCTAAELAYHALASHDIPTALAASVRAGLAAERQAAPAEAHRHYDLALSLWERVSDPDKLAGVSRAELGLRSAVTAADAGDISRAVQLLRRLAGYVDPAAQPVLASRVSERLARFLLEIDEEAAGLAAARAAVAALPDDPPSAHQAQALATLAIAHLCLDESGPARRNAERAREAGRAAAAPWAVADALVTLGMLAERSGRPKTAAASYARARAQARRAGVLAAELRATFQVARVQLESGDLSDASRTAHEGIVVAERAGLAMAPHGYDLQYLHYLAHFNDGQWDHAQEIADGFTVRVTSEAEARLSAMALFIAVARGSESVGQRRAWLEPYLARDGFTEYIARGLLAEHAWWAGDIQAALDQAAATVRATLDWGGPAASGLIRLAAVWLAALADHAVAARAGGDAVLAAAAAAEAERVIGYARSGASGTADRNSPPRPGLGVDGRGWLARAEAEYGRARGDNDPRAWQAVLDAFGPAFRYEAARSRWRLAQALAEAGDRDAARDQWAQAVATADELGAVPLRRALDALGRRARLSAAPAAGHGAGRGPLAALTSRETDVLRLLAAGHSNREIAAALFIAPKTASVHVSNILGKLGAATRTEAAAIAHGNGLRQHQE